MSITKLAPWQSSGPTTETVQVGPHAGRRIITGMLTGHDLSDLLPKRQPHQLDVSPERDER